MQAVNDLIRLHDGTNEQVDLGHDCFQLVFQPWFIWYASKERLSAKEGLTLSALLAKSDDKLMRFFFLCEFFPYAFLENRAQHCIQIASLGDNLHKLSKTVSRIKKKGKEKLIQHLAG